MNRATATKLPENKESLDLMLSLSDMRDYLQTAINLLQEEPNGSNEWKKKTAEFIAAANFEFFGGPAPDAEEHPF